MKNASNNVVKSFPTRPGLTIKMRTSPLKPFFRLEGRSFASACIRTFILSAYPKKVSLKLQSKWSTPTKLAPTPVDSESAQLKNHAVTTAKAIEATYPESAFTQILLGSAYFNTGQTEMAAIHLKKCLELNPNILEAHEIVTRIAYEKGHPEESLRLCIEARNRGLISPALLNRMARAQMDLGRTEESIETLLEATKLGQPLPESFLFTWTGAHASPQLSTS
jgi:tetratricopeptide (TPR) repeat protein